MGEYKDFNKYNCAPFAADHIGVYDKNGNKVSNIKLGNFKPDYGKRLYRFGLLADVHNQKATIIDDDRDFINALTFFNNKESVNFTCICGDITENGTTTELNNYKTNVDTYSPNTPVYTCTGNHDCSNYNDSNWFYYTGCERCQSFPININGSDDLFVLFGMRYWSLGSTGMPFYNEDIDWLENILKNNENKRVFIFIHLFFPDKAGNFNRIYPSHNWLGGAQLERLTRLNELYVNAIWFSGHSHWMWYLQSLPDTYNNTENNDTCNVCRLYDENNNPLSGWTVHVPSCAKPIDSNGETRDDGDESDACSEGAIVDVYDNYIVIRGVSFKDKSDSVHTLKYLPIAQYKLDTSIVSIDIDEPTKPEPFVTDFITASDCIINPSKKDGCTVTQEGSYVVFTFDKTSQGFYIKPNNYTSELSCYLQLYDVAYLSPSVWTSSEYAKVGFYKQDGSYTMSTDDIIKNDNNGVQFNVSSSYPGDFPVVIKIKFKFKFS